MNSPFIIWTMQRTGGTALTSALEDLSGRTQIQHEPFNLDRLYGAVTARWLENRDYALLVDEIRRQLATKPIIKHCYEMPGIDSGLDAALLQLAGEYGYRHVHLERQDEVARLLSLELANATGAWNREQASTVYGDVLLGAKSLPDIDIGDCIDHCKHCQRRSAELNSLFRDAETTVMRMTSEQLYASPVSGHRNFNRLASFLGYTSGELATADQRITDFLENGDQKSATILPCFPNYKAARMTLSGVIAAERATRSDATPSE